MQKKKKSIILASIVLAVLLFGAVGVYLLTNRQEVIQERKLTDIEWYDENATEFVITTAQELYDLKVLSQYYDFKGQTVKLGGDIVVNEGKAEDWAKKAPVNKWFPIQGFAGTFNGQGHTISGIYGYGVSTSMGLFTDTKSNCIIKDFKLLNSYFKEDGMKPIGSIVGNGCGTIEKIYSDAIVTTNGNNAGGIVGVANVDGENSATAKMMKVDNCWFDGSVALTTKTGRYGGGIVGRVSGGTLNLVHCLNAGTISSESQESNGLYVGGIIGALTYVNYSGAINMEDCLNVGKIEVTKSTATGSIAGGTVAKTNFKIRDSYTIEQSYGEVCNYAKGVSDGGVPMINTDLINGKDWYRWTTLDYQNYWTVTEDGTPVLRSFADKVVDTTGLEKVYSFDWYSETEYEMALSTKEDLIGFALMSYWDTFEARMVVLANDIVVNEGNATEWAEGKNIPELVWIPAGRTPAFQGTFNGLDHTISGLYGVTGSPFMGVFGWVGNFGEVTRLSVKNSYFETTNVSSGALGSITGRLEGKLNTTYSDAIIKSAGGLVGGIAGYKLTDNVSKMTNCWYDGTLMMVGDKAKNTGGLMGRLIKGTIEIDNCLFSGTITVEGKKRTGNIGGYIGNVAAGTVSIKSSLISGEVVNIGTEKVNAIGRVFGQVANSETITITFEDAYVTDKGGTYFWYCAGKLPKVVGGVELKEEKFVLGYNGYCTTNLDFDKYWAVVVNKDGTPILKSFADKVPSVAGLKKVFDKSWYDPAKTTYILKDSQDMYGFLYLSNSKIDFAGKTVKLANDIVILPGNAKDWEAGKNVPSEIYNWVSIGKTTNFQGTFDGQGHTLSGIYGKTDTAFMGLFGWLGPDSVVKNLKIKNSYFESTVEGSAAIGSVAGRCEGSVDTVYSDAIITTQAALNGGIVGYKKTDTDKPTTIKNCWFDGTINMLGDKSKFTGGMIGRIIEGSVVIDNCLFSGTFAIGGKTRSTSTGGFAGMVAGNLTIKNSLNSGQHIVTEAEKMNSVGRVMGQVSNTETTKVTIDNTYYTDRSGTYKWYCAGKLPTIIGVAEAKKESEVLGYNGFRKTGLDFDKYWAVVINEDSTPILKSFASKVPSLAGIEKEFDKSWYDPAKTTYVLYDKADLYGLAYLMESNVDFKGKTIKLGKDIVVNNENAENWANGQVPENIWKPIGKTTAFQGTFDGNGKTISGLYCVENTTYAGLFAWTGVNSEIKNLRITNSYFESTTTSSDGAVIGSVAGRCEGNLENVYSNAIVRSANAFNGGLVGYKANDSEATYTNCWYDGIIYMAGNSSKMTGGIIGRVVKGELTIDNCLFSGALKIGGGTRSASTGGLVGAVIAKLNLVDSMNTGSHEFTEVEKVNSVGRVIGQIENKATTIVTFDNTYYTNNSGTYRWYKSGDLPTITGEPILVDEADVTGEFAYYYTKLNYDKYWAIVTKDVNGADGTPVLKSFATAIPALPLPPSYADISWYDESKTEHIIYDSADLYGLSYLSKAGKDFKGQTIKIADSVDEIQMNVNAVATDWAAGTTTPEYNWEPIGKRVAFAGTFDGNGKTISGLYGKTDTTYMGLFAKTAEGSTVQNLKLTNSYFESAASKYDVVASIVAFCSGDVENVYSDAIINSKSQVAAGLVGIAWSKGTVNIKNSWYNGSITHEHYYTAGIVAWVQNGTVNVENCLNSGTLNYEVTGANGNAGGICANIMMYNWDEDREPNSSDSGYSACLNIKNSLNVGQLTSGTKKRVGSILGNKSDNTGMTLENVYTTNESYKYDGISTALGRATSGKYTGTVNMVDAIDITGEMAYFNTSLDYVDVWGLVANGTPVLRAFASNTIAIPQAPAGTDTSWYNGGESTYTLSDEEDLYGFAYLSEMGMDFQGKTIKLDRDITVNAGTVAEWEANNFADLKLWNPIGTADKKFAGTFDGQGHSISGIYIKNGKVGVALFRGTTADSEIKNLKLVNSYISASGNFAGSFVGSASGNLTNLYSDAKIVSTKSYIGGIVGQVWTDAGNDVVISGCWFDGSISAGSNIGGIVAIGSKGNFELLNCLNTGNIPYTVGTSSTQKWVGGLVGRTLRSSSEWSVTEDTSATMTFKMTNCLNLGKISDSKDYRVGSALGQNNGPTFTFTNVYTTNESYKSDGTATAVGRNKNGGAVKYAGISLVAQADITVAGTVTNANVQSKLAGFDFKNTWAIGADGTPVLQWAATLEFDTKWYDESATTYTIETTEELYGLSYLSSLGVDFAGKTIVLAKDIALNDGTVAEWMSNNFAGLTKWTPISSFAGTFDGKNHSIKGLYVNSTEQGAGLFKNTVSGSMIQNLKLENSYISANNTIAGSVIGSCGGNMQNVYSSANVISTKSYLGGLVGQIYSEGTVDISNCWFAGKVNGESNAAGIAGVATRGTITITNCLNSGTISNLSTKDTAGGLVARTFRSNELWGLNDGAVTLTLTMKKCLNTGTITGRNNIGSAVGWHQKYTMVLENVYATETSTGASTSGVLVGKVQSSATLTGSVTGVALADITVAGNVTEANVISKLSGFDFDLVWGIGEKGTPELAWVNSLHTNTSWYDETKTEFTITALKELKGLAELSRAGVTFEGKTIKLGANIVVNEGTPTQWAESGYANVKNWTPIGTDEKPFAGIFDGQGHTISGVYGSSTEQIFGLFEATAEGSTIKNLKLTDSYFVNTADITGSVVGQCAGNLINVYSQATVVGRYYVGGLIGKVWTEGKADIKQCWFAGSLTVNGNQDGGIVGIIASGTITMENCLNTGTIDCNQKLFIGGLCGSLLPSSEDGTITITVNMKNCLSYGTITDYNATSERPRTGSVIGNVNGLAQVVVSAENVYATNECYAGVEKAIGVGDGKLDSGSITKVGKSNITVAGNVTIDKVKSTLAGFNFDSVWKIGSTGMPELR